MEHATAPPGAPQDRLAEHLRNCDDCQFPGHPCRAFTQLEVELKLCFVAAGGN